MYPVSTRFLNVLRDTHATATYMDLYYNGALAQAMIPVASGTVTVDRNQTIRRTCSAVIGDPGLFPTYVQSPLSPFGAEAYIYQGITFMDGTSEVVPLGIFSLETITFEESVSQSNGGLPQIVGNDRSIVLQRETFLTPVDYSGWTTWQAITKLVQTALPQVTVNFASSLLNPTLPGGTAFSGTRLDAVQTLAAGIGAEAYFDVNGVFQVIPVPVVNQANLTGGLQNPSWTVDASTPAAQSFGASPKGVLVQAARGISRTDAYNGIAVYGTGTTSSATPYGTAFDIDPRSPSYWGGPFASSKPGPYGHVTTTIQIQTVTTNAQAVVAAQAALSNSLGLVRTLGFTCAPNPALEAGDFLKLIYSDGTNELHLLDSFSVPLDLTQGTMTGTTRTTPYQKQAGQ